MKSESGYVIWVGLLISVALGALLTPLVVKIIGDDVNKGLEIGWILVKIGVIYIFVAGSFICGSYLKWGNKK